MKKRITYEGKLIHLFEKHTPFYGQRGTNSHGIDVLLFQNSTDGLFSLCMRGEIKTSTSTKLWLRSDREKRQYENYMKTYSEHNATTVYFYRLITRMRQIEIKRRGKPPVEIKLNSEEDRWRVFFVENIPLSKSGAPILDFIDGITFKTFIDIINSEDFSSR